MATNHAKGMTKTKAASVTESTDLIVVTAKEIENMTKSEAFELVPTLIEDQGFSSFKLGGILSAIQEHGWWEGEAPSFKEFIPAEFNIHYRKAMYLVKIYNKLVEAEVPWDKVKGIGWTKLKELARIITVENVDEWVALAEVNTVHQLIELIKEALAASGNLTADGTTEADTSGVTTITFKVHPDQKESILLAVVQAMAEVETEYKAVALEAICLNYLSGGNTKKDSKPKSLSSLMKNYSIEEVLMAFEVIWPDVDLTVAM